MSTRSNICVKLRREDIGKTLRCDVNKLLSSYPEKAFHEVELDGSYITVYSHFDGYPSGVGSILVENFNDYDSALNLVLGGSMSRVGIGKDWVPYAVRSDEPWDWNKPKISIAIPEATEDYLYIFTLGRWWVTKFMGYNFVDVEAILRGEEKDPWEED